MRPRYTLLLLKESHLRNNGVDPRSRLADLESNRSRQPKHSRFGGAVAGVVRGPKLARAARGVDDADTAGAPVAELGSDTVLVAGQVDINDEVPVAVECVDDWSVLAHHPGEVRGSYILPMKVRN